MHSDSDRNYNKEYNLYYDAHRALFSHVLKEIEADVSILDRYQFVSDGFAKDTETNTYCIPYEFFVGNRYGYFGAYINIKFRSHNFSSLEISNFFYNNLLCNQLTEYIKKNNICYIRDVEKIRLLHNKVKRLLHIPEKHWLCIHPTIEKN